MRTVPITDVDMATLGHSVAEHLRKRTADERRDFIYQLAHAMCLHCFEMHVPPGARCYCWKDD